MRIESSFSKGKCFHFQVKTYLPEIIWTDGEWETEDDYWLAKEFLAWLYNESPVKDTVVVNDRWGSNTLGKHGGYLTCADRYNPSTVVSYSFYLISFNNET